MRAVTDTTTAEVAPFNGNSFDLQAHLLSGRPAQKMFYALALSPFVRPVRLY
jgi:hypothetical protein